MREALSLYNAAFMLCCIGGCEFYEERTILEN